MTGTRVRRSTVPLVFGILSLGGCAPDASVTKPPTTEPPASPQVTTEAPGVGVDPSASSEMTPLPTRSSIASSIPDKTHGLEPTHTTEPIAGSTGSIHTTTMVVSIPTAGPDRAAGTVSVATPPASTPNTGTEADGTADPAPHVPPESVDVVDRRINVTVGGEDVYIRNGGRIELGDGRTVEVFLDPYPPTTLHSVVDLYITQDGEPLIEAAVDVEFDMLAMEHGPFVAAARDIGAGHHLVTLDYIMFGAWDQVFTIYIGLERIRIPMVIAAYP